MTKAKQKHNAGRRADRRIYLCGLTASIVCVILDQAGDLPRYKMCRFKTAASMTSQTKSCRIRSE